MASSRVCCSFFEDIGPPLVSGAFGFSATIFIFVLSANWSGLIPELAPLGADSTLRRIPSIDQPLFRGANAD